jgi:hypothetical protein
MMRWRKLLMDFENMTWKCHCCGQERKDKYIKVTCYDVSDTIGHEVGVMFFNLKYCVDVPACQEKAFNREWVYKHFFKKESS